MSISSPAAPVPQAPESGPPLLRRQVDSVVILTLNRPANRNALSEAMLGALGEAFANIAADRSVRAVVLAANGPVYSAGHDMKELSARRSDADRGRAYFKQVMDGCSAVMQMIVRLPQPVIAAVEGVATAAGCQLVASCDMAIASRNASFATPGVNIGLFCSTPMVALSRNISRKHAMEMLLTGDTVNAVEASDLGLINFVVAPGETVEEALVISQKIASKSAATIRIGKEAFYRQLEMGLSEAYSYTAEVMTENMLLRDAEEGIGAFLEKRAPQWEDR